jgi:hypothetical protein
MSDVFRHRNRTRKSYCRTRSDVVSERVKKVLIFRRPENTLNFCIRETASFSNRILPRGYSKLEIFLFQCHIILYNLFPRVFRLFFKYSISHRLYISLLSYYHTFTSAIYHIFPSVYTAILGMALSGRCPSFISWQHVSALKLGHHQVSLDVLIHYIL